MIKGAVSVLADVKAGLTRPKDVLVLQEEFNESGLSLLNEGSVGQVLICLESKMYSPIFYDQLPEFKKYFKYQILFGNLGTHSLYFPSYDEEDLTAERPERSIRKEICMISSNKQWWNLPLRWTSPSWCEAIRNELHTERLRQIEKYPEMDLYGPGWDRLDNLPPQWAHLKPQIQKMWKGVCHDKLETLSQYKQAIAIENTNLPGYFTEKVPHCLVANTKPITHAVFSCDRYLFNNKYFAHQVMELMEK